MDISQQVNEHSKQWHGQSPRPGTAYICPACDSLIRLRFAFQAWQAAEAHRAQYGDLIPVPPYAPDPFPSSYPDEEALKQRAAAGEAQARDLLFVLGWED